MSPKRSRGRRASRDECDPGASAENQALPADQRASPRSGPSRTMGQALCDWGDRVVTRLWPSCETPEL